MATAEQTVSAVLDATNKRYVVETGTSEEGTIRYTRFSDGYIFIEGNIPITGNGITDIPFPISFSNTKYAFVSTSEGTGSSNSVIGVKVDNRYKTEQGIRAVITYNNGGYSNGYGSNGIPFSFIACGY